MMNNNKSDWHVSKLALCALMSVPLWIVFQWLGTILLGMASRRALFWNGNGESTKDGFYGNGYMWPRRFKQVWKCPPKVARTVLWMAVRGQRRFMYGSEWALWVQAGCWLYKGEEGEIGGHHIIPGKTSLYLVISYLALETRIWWIPPLIRIQFLITLIALPDLCSFFSPLDYQGKPFLVLTGTLQRTRGGNHLSFI